MTTTNAAGALLGRVRAIRIQEESSALDHMEVGLVTADFRISTIALKDLVAREREAAGLLYERMWRLAY